MMENGNLYSDIPSETNQCDCCDECGQAFLIKSEDDLSSDDQSENNDSQDEDTSNPPEKNHKCDLCSKKFITSVAILFHKKAHHSANSSATELEVHATDNDNTINDNAINYNPINDKPINYSSFNREYQNVTDLETLTRLHDTQNVDGYPRKCSVCDRELFDAVDVEIHEIYHKTKNNNSSLRCKSCNKSFSNATELKMHEIYHDAIDAMDFNAVDPKPSGKTQTTNDECTIDENLTEHNSCDPELSRQTNITNHDKNPIQTSLGPRIIKTPIKCSCCKPEPIKRTRSQQQRQRRNHLKVHVGSHTRERPFPCDNCNKSFLQMQHLVEHKRIHTAEKPYNCDVCNKRFSIKGNLRKHKVVHTGLKMYNCDICNSSLSTMFSLERHLNRKHKRNITNICKVCNQTFKRSCHLAKHQRKHTKRDTENSLVCMAPTVQATVVHSVAGRGQTDNAIAHTECGKVRTESSLCTSQTLQVTAEDRLTESEQPAYNLRLRKHRQSKLMGCNTGDKTHSNDEEIYNKCLSAENPAQCGICHKIFSGRHYLRIHVGSHTRERPFPCDICDKSFLVMQHLIEHERTHTGEKPYKCNVCNKRFSMKGNVKKHEVVHTGLKLYCCDICDRSYTTIFSLERHLKVTHKRIVTKICKICNQTFKKSCHLANHQRKHTGKDNESNVNAAPNPQVEAVQSLTESVPIDNTERSLSTSPTCQVSVVHELTCYSKHTDKRNVTKICNICDRTSKRWCHLANHQHTGKNRDTNLNTQTGGSLSHTVPTFQIAETHRLADSVWTNNADSSMCSASAALVADLCRQTKSRMEYNARANTESSQSHTVPNLQVAGTHQLTDSGIRNNADGSMCSASAALVADLCRLPESRMEYIARANTESRQSCTTVPNLQITKAHRLTDSVLINKADNSRCLVSTPLVADLHRPTESRTRDSVRIHREIGLYTVPALQVSNVPTECRATESGTSELSSDFNTRVETSPTVQVTDVQPWLAEKETDTSKTATPTNYDHRIEALPTSYSANSNTQLYSDPQWFVNMTSHDKVDNDLNDELHRELEATEPTGMTYICFKCDTEFELPWQLLKHVDKVHPAGQAS